MSEHVDLPASWQELAWLEELVSAGGRAFAVGGAVRDWLRGDPPLDLDVVVQGLDRVALCGLLARHGRVDEVGAAFAVLKWRAAGVGEPVDVALPRVERSTGPAHRDFEVEAGPGVSIEADLGRRDFTINAIAIDLVDGTCHDPFGGRADLLAGRLRAVGDPARRFEEDPLRILRGAGFAARFELEVDPQTREGMRQLAAQLDSVSAERMGGELVKLLGRARRPSLGLRLLLEVGALAQVLPELLPSVGFQQNSPHHHLDVWEHVLLCVDTAAAREASMAVRLAALLHDVAKPETYSEEQRPDGTPLGHFLRHEQRGAEVAAQVLARLRIGAVPGVDADVPERVRRLVLHHLVSIDAGSSERALRRFVHRAGGLEAALELLELWAADRSAHAGGLDLALHAALVARIEASGDVPVSSHQLALRGSAIAEHLGLAGREIGALKQRLLEAVVAGDVVNEVPALLALAERLLAEESAADATVDS